MVGGQPAITGNFTVDRARISMPEMGAPSLGDDVVILRDGKPVNPQKAPGQPAGPLSPRVNVTVNLGRDFRFEGSGADLRLAGSVKLQSDPGEAPQAYGTVQVVEGSYEAFGTELAIDRGVINFQGSLQNPNVNILAMRREREASVGIQVTGTARRPRVELVSDPYMSQEEQLSWLIFGRGGAAAGGTGQAQRAARGAALGLANMLGGERAAQALGLDAISIGESEYGTAGTQVVSLGKTLSDRLYLGYEQSLSGAESVLKLVYEWTRSWSVVLLGGTVTGVELTYSKRFDRIKIK
jgi:translocation and assembly module TamB